jgi:general secretion pathway protein N
MKKLAWILVALGLIAVLIVLTAPARLFTDRIVERNPQLTLAGVSGSWWNGEVADLRVNGRPVGKLNWQLRPASLLSGMPATDVEISGGGIELTGLLLRGTDHAVLRDVKGHIDARWLQPAVGIPLLSFTGRVAVDLREFRGGRGGLPHSLDLSLTWADAGVTGLAAARLGSITVLARGADGRFDGRIHSQPEDPLSVDGGFQLADRRYRAEVRLRPRDPADPVAQALQWVGQPDGQGGRLLIVEGELLLPPAEVPPS